MAPVERPHRLRKRTVDRVHHWHADAIGHCERRESRVVVQHVEHRASLGRMLDLLPRAGDVI